MVLLVICFHFGITNSSAIQRYRDLHEFRKTDPDDKTSGATSFRRIIFNETDNVTTEKTSNINVHRSSTFNLSISRSSAIQRYRDLHEFRKPNLEYDKVPRPSNNIQENSNNGDIDGLEKTTTNAKTVPSSLFMNSIHFPSETELRSCKFTFSFYFVAKFLK